jgi:Protein of unknown function (DUF1214)
MRTVGFLCARIFAAPKRPAANYWSSTSNNAAFGTDDFTCTAAAKRDGSLTIYVQADPPPEAQRPDWLPAQKALISRCSLAEGGGHRRLMDAARCRTSTRSLRYVLDNWVVRVLKRLCPSLNQGSWS